MITAFSKRARFMSDAGAPPIGSPPLRQTRLPGWAATTCRLLRAPICWSNLATRTDLFRLARRRLGRPSRYVPERDKIPGYQKTGGSYGGLTMPGDPTENRNYYRDFAKYLTFLALYRPVRLAISTRAVAATDVRVDLRCCPTPASGSLR